MTRETVLESIEINRGRATMTFRDRLREITIDSREPNRKHRNPDSRLARATAPRVKEVNAIRVIRGRSLN